MIAEIASMTPRQRSHYTYLADVMMRLDWDVHHTIHRGGRIPAEWEEIARETPRRAKRKVTFEVEEDVLKFFRSMGKGHGPRMNEVLRSYMHARIAGVVKGAETLAQYRAGAARNEGPRPWFGDSARMLGLEPEEEPEVMTKEALLDKIAVLMAGRLGPGTGPKGAP